MLMDGKYDGKAVSDKPLTKAQVRIRILALGAVVVGVLAVAFVLELDFFEFSFGDLKKSARAVVACWNDEPLSVASYFNEEQQLVERGPSE